MMKVYDSQKFVKFRGNNNGRTPKFSGARDLKFGHPSISAIRNLSKQEKARIPLRMQSRSSLYYRGKHFLFPSKFASGF